MTSYLKNKMALLEVKNISKSFGDSQIIENINLFVDKGELVCLLGVSGVGKSTLFNILAGVLSPSAGQVNFQAENITNQAGQLSYMLQKDLLLEHMTILDNVSLPLLIRGEKKDLARSQALPYLDIFGLENCQDLYPKELSGGMRQRAALLRTYLFSDQLALLDEPFSALDTITKSQMHDWYLKIMEEIKLSTLFITHDIDEAILLSDRIYIMTGRPGVISKELVIENNYKNKEDFILSNEFLNYKRTIINSLHRKTP